MTCSFPQAFFKRDWFVISSKKIHFGNHYAGTSSETISNYLHDQVGLKHLDREKLTLSVTKGYHRDYSHVLLLVFQLSLFDISWFIQDFFSKCCFWNSFGHHVRTAMRIQEVLMHSSLTLDSSWMHLVLFPATKPFCCTGVSFTVLS